MLQKINQGGKMYRLIAIDLDGTLLNSYGEISDENKKAIKMAKEKGIEIVLTSGRMSTSVKDIANEIDANNYIIARKWCNYLWLEKWKNII